MLLRKYVATQRSNDLGRLATLEGTVQSIQDVTKRQSVNSNDMSAELHRVKLQLMEMSRNMSEMCNRLDRELAHVGDMTVLRCGTCGKTTTSKNAKDWTSSSDENTTKKDQEEKQENKIFIGRKSNLKLRHRRLFSKRIGGASNSRVRRVGFRGGKVLRPQTSDI
jgi:hypothetical protein